MVILLKAGDCCWEDDPEPRPESGLGKEGGRRGRCREGDRRRVRG